jgi:thiamine-phosphate pyrophosphorylase
MLRPVDANLNRVSEGLRVLEDIARFVLDDGPLTQQFRALRHQLAEVAAPVSAELLSARNVATDVAAEEPAGGQESHVSLVLANARRVQESLRVLEEFARLPEIALDGSQFGQARFAVYDLERRLLSRLLRQEKVQRLSGLYVIIDTGALKGRVPGEVAREALRGGARVIQLRDKERDRGELLSIARELKSICEQEEALFLINDHLDLALAAGADGLHLGQTDLPLATARHLLPIDKIIGVSTKTVEQARKAEEEGADYVAVGAMFPSPSKESRVVGTETLRQIRRAVSLPLVAIGGIGPENAAEVVAAGADALAVISAVAGAEDVAGAARELVAAMGARDEK